MCAPLCINTIAICDTATAPRSSVCVIIRPIVTFLFLLFAVTSASAVTQIFATLTRPWAIVMRPDTIRSK